MDGDLGPYDAVEIRLQAADTVILLDFSLTLCAWRAIRRSYQRLDFWLWLFQYRRQSRPFLMKAIDQHASNAAIRLLRNPKEADAFLAGIADGHFTLREQISLQQR